MAKKRKPNTKDDALDEEAEIVSFHSRAMQNFYAWDGDVLVLNVLGTPSAKKNVIGKVKGNQLKISVTASPVAGRATDYMVKWLADEFGVHKKDIEVVFGRMSVHKQLRILAPKTLPKVIEKLENQRKKSKE